MNLSEEYCIWIECINFLQMTIFIDINFTVYFTEINNCSNRQEKLTHALNACQWTSLYRNQQLQQSARKTHPCNKCMSVDFTVLNSGICHSTVFATRHKLLVLPLKHIWKTNPNSFSNKLNWTTVKMCVKNIVYKKHWVEFYYWIPDNCHYILQ